MTPTLLATWLEIVAPWREVFPQARTWRRAVRQALGSLVCLGRRCLSRIIWTIPFVASLRCVIGLPGIDDHDPRNGRS